VITSLADGAVNAEVELTTLGGDKIVAIVTGGQLLSIACGCPPAGLHFTVGNLSFIGKREMSMNEEVFNLSIRKFLKMVGVNSQREIEHAVAKALADGTIAGTESFPAKVTLEVAGFKLKVEFDGEITLQ